MSMGHSHDTGGGQGKLQTATGSHRRRLMVVLVVYGTIVAAEVIGAFVTDSLALIAEAGHMTVDASGIIIALIGTYLASRKATNKRTYGMMRAEIIAVLINCLLLFVLGGFILYEAVERWFNPADVQGGGVIIFAVVGLIGASISLVVLSRGAKESLNVKAAFLEVMSDGIGSAAIIISGLLNVTLGWKQGDAIAAAAIGVIILPRAFALLKQALNIILQGVPDGIDIEKVHDAIEETDGVQTVHSLHVWALTSGVPVMSAHIVLSEDAREHDQAVRVLDQVTQRMQELFNIEHSTIQIEEPGHLEHEGLMHRELDETANPH